MDSNKLKLYKSLFDENVGLVRGVVDQEIHTRFKKNTPIHWTRDSLYFANCLLDDGSEDAVKLANSIIKKVIDLQDKRPDSPTCGLWSWYYEETLDQMNPPDYNFADFCAKALLIAAISHADKLVHELSGSIKEAVYLACESIIKRNVQPDYTNISVMGGCVTCLAGELYSDDRFISFGRKKFTDILAYSIQMGGFNEYNSVNYTKLVIDDIKDFISLSKDRTSKEMAMKLLDICWRYLAEHFHIKTQEWTAPQSRRYETLSLPERKEFYKAIADGKEELFPEQYIKFFKQPYTKMYREVFYNGQNGEPNLEASWYITPNYTLGSFATMDLWCQRRSLNGYWGTSDDTKYIDTRLKLNGKDFACAHLHTLQENNLCLGIINFVKDGGTFHLHHDRISGTINISDFRLRFELKADGAVTTENGWYVLNDGIRVGLCIKKVCGEFKPETVISYEDGFVYIDVILYSGAERTLDFTKTDRLAIAFVLTMDDESLHASDIAVNDNGNILSLETEYNNKKLRLSVDTCIKTLEDVYYSRSSEIKEEI